MEIPHILQQVGLSNKEILVYMTLLSGGPSSVRKLAKETNTNRGSVYDTLKALQTHGLVGMYQKHKKQFFLAEDPEKLLDVVEHRERSITSLRRGVSELLPELKSLYVHGGMKPVVKYYEGAKGVNIILQDVLRTMSDQSDKLYRVYSSSIVREYLYKEFPHFTKERIERRIQVKVVALGAGGEEQPFADRRWLTQHEGSPTYSIIYGPKVAFFALSASEVPIGVLVEDGRVAETQRMIFDHVWETLKVESRTRIVNAI